MNLLKHMIRGCRDLPGYGPHPGVGMLFILILITGLAGAQRGSIAGFIGGSIFGAAVYLPMFLYGAYSRSKDYERDQIQLLRKIKDA